MSRITVQFGPHIRAYHYPEAGGWGFEQAVYFQAGHPTWCLDSMNEAERRLAHASLRAGMQSFLACLDRKE